jgi:hypothetical protein
VGDAWFSGDRRGPPIKSGAAVVVVEVEVEEMKRGK